MAQYSNLGLTGEHIAANEQLYEAARSNFFVFEISGLNGIVKASYSGSAAPTATSTTDRYQNAEDYLRLNVTKASVPDFSINPLSYKRGNETIKFAGVPTWDEGSITVDDVVGLDTKGILEAWKALTYNQYTRKGGRMADWTDSNGVAHMGYKKTCTLMEYTQDYELIRTWTLYGCWISKINHDGFDRSSDQMRTLTATVQYDRAELSYEASTEPSLVGTATSVE